MADISIVVCTYLRPGPLERALTSALALEVPPGLEPEFIVVDNSDDGSARALVERLAATSRFPVAFVEAHPPNISVARNAGVAAAKAPVIAFIDDDQVMEPDWLKAVADGLATCRHDVFFGRVRPVFEALDRVTPAIRTLFSRDVPASRGAALYATGPEKTPGVALGTNNSIFRRARVFDGSRPFDPAYGHAGGEDYDLFCRLQVRGLSFGWLPDASVTEEVPASRCDGGYLRRRAYSGGQVYAAAAAAAAPSPAAERWKIRLKAAAQALLLAPVALSLPFRDAATRADFSFRMAGVLGKLSFGSPYPLYRENDPSPKASA